MGVRVGEKEREFVLQVSRSSVRTKCTKSYLCVLRLERRVGGVTSEHRSLQQALSERCAKSHR